jgi:DMSO reductase iron-sulfur subunit
MPKQLGFHHNMANCIGCKACQMACKNEYELEAEVNWRRVYPFREDPGAPERNFMSVACNHCENPECVRVCPVGAYTKREDGIVEQNHDKCIGCRLCTMACPYGATRYSPSHRKASKCELCKTRLDAGLKPACVEACPARALTMIELDTFENPAAVASVPGFPNSNITNPSIRFTPPVAGKQYRRDA